MTLAEFRETRAQKKRQSILAAAESAFMSHGYARAPMEKIAGEAKVSTATLYRHFPSKADLFEAVSAEALHNLRGAPLTLGPDPVQNMRAAAVAYAELLSTPRARALVRMLIAEVEHSPEIAERFYAAVKSDLSDGFSAVYLDGVKRGIFVPFDNPAHVAGQLQGMIEHGTLMRGLVLGNTIDADYSPEEIAVSALETWLAQWRKN